MRIHRAFALVPVVALCGCAHLAELMGLSIDLRHQKVQSISARLAGGPALCPGMAAPLVVTAILDGGKSVATQGAGGGKVTWDSFQISGQAASVARNGLVTLDADPRATFGKTATLDIVVAGDPAHHARVSIAPRYDCAFTADFSGKNGENGSDGFSGHDGIDGRDEMSSGDEARPGGTGQNGAKGHDGDNGRDGRDAGDVEVTVALARATPALLAVDAHGLRSGWHQLFLVDPHGGSVTVRADGGAGGNGGNGGHGGAGGHGGDGAPAGNGGDGGDGGDGGEGGNGGDGGRISVRVARAARPYLSALTFDNAGGSGGSAGHAGFGGDGGITYSGASQGRDGQMGQDGRRSGNAGQSGPAPSIVVGPVDAF